MGDPPVRSSWDGGRGNDWQARRDDISMSYPRPAFRLASPSQPRLNRLALASIVFALLWGFGIGSLLAVAFGVVAKRQIRRRRQSGRRMASIGIALGAIGLVTTAVAAILIVFFDDNTSVGDQAALNDVAAAPCAIDPATGTISAALTVTNSTDIASNYLITLEIAGPDDDTAGYAFAHVGNLAPGAVAQAVATSNVAEPATPVCTVTTVSRYAAPGATPASTSAPADTNATPTPTS